MAMASNASTATAPLHERRFSLSKMLHPQKHQQHQQHHLQPTPPTITTTTFLSSTTLSTSPSTTSNISDWTFSNNNTQHRQHPQSPPIQQQNHGQHRSQNHHHRPQLHQPVAGLTFRERIQRMGFFGLFHSHYHQHHQHRHQAKDQHRHPAPSSPPPQLSPTTATTSAAQSQRNSKHKEHQHKGQHQHQHHQGRRRAGSSGMLMMTGSVGSGGVPGSPSLSATSSTNTLGKASHTAAHFACQVTVNDFRSSSHHQATTCSLPTRVSDLMVFDRRVFDPPPVLSTPPSSLADAIPVNVAVNAGNHSSSNSSNNNSSSAVATVNGSSSTASSSAIQKSSSLGGSGNALKTISSDNIHSSNGNSYSGSSSSASFPPPPLSSSPFAIRQFQSSEKLNASQQQHQPTSSSPIAISSATILSSAPKKVHHKTSMRSLSILNLLVGSHTARANGTAGTGSSSPESPSALEVHHNQHPPPAPQQTSQLASNVSSIAGSNNKPLKSTTSRLLKKTSRRLLLLPVLTRSTAKDNTVNNFMSLPIGGGGSSPQSARWNQGPLTPGDGLYNLHSEDLSVTEFAKLAGITILPDDEIGSIDGMDDGYEIDDDEYFNEIETRFSASNSSCDIQQHGQQPRRGGQSSQISYLSDGTSGPMVVGGMLGIGNNSALGGAGSSNTRLDGYDSSGSHHNSLNSGTLGSHRQGGGITGSLRHVKMNIWDKNFWTSPNNTATLISASRLGSHESLAQASSSFSSDPVHPLTSSTEERATPNGHVYQNIGLANSQEVLVEMTGKANNAIGNHDQRQSTATNPSTSPPAPPSPSSRPRSPLSTVQHPGTISNRRGSHDVIASRTQGLAPPATSVALTDGWSSSSSSLLSSASASSPPSLAGSRRTSASLSSELLATQHQLQQRHSPMTPPSTTARLSTSLPQNDRQATGVSAVATITATASTAAGYSGSTSKGAQPTKPSSNSSGPPVPASSSSQLARSNSHRRSFSSLTAIAIELDAADTAVATTAATATAIATDHLMVERGMRMTNTVEHTELVTNISPSVSPSQSPTPNSHTRASSAPLKLDTKLRPLPPASLSTANSTHHHHHHHSVPPPRSPAQAKANKPFIPSSLQHESTSSISSTLPGETQPQSQQTHQQPLLTRPPNSAPSLRSPLSHPGIANSAVSSTPTHTLQPPVFVAGTKIGRFTLVEEKCTKHNDMEKGVLASSSFPSNGTILAPSGGPSRRASTTSLTATGRALSQDTVSLPSSPPPPPTNEMLTIGNLFARANGSSTSLHSLSGYQHSSRSPRHSLTHLPTCRPHGECTEGCLVQLGIHGGSGNGNMSDNSMSSAGSWSDGNSNSNGWIDSTSEGTSVFANGTIAPELPSTFITTSATATATTAGTSLPKTRIGQNGCVITEQDNVVIFQRKKKVPKPAIVLMDGAMASTESL